MADNNSMIHYHPKYTLFAFDVVRIFMFHALTGYFNNNINPDPNKLLDMVKK